MSNINIQSSQVDEIVDSKGSKFSFSERLSPNYRIILHLISESPQSYSVNVDTNLVENAQTVFLVFPACSFSINVVSSPLNYYGNIYVKAPPSPNTLNISPQGNIVVILYEDKSYYIRIGSAIQACVDSYTFSTTLSGACSISRIDSGNGFNCGLQILCHYEMII
jgi:hypothetical protein